MTKHYNLRDREKDNSEMDGDGAGNLQALEVTDSGAGGQSSGTSDMASGQQLELLQLQLKIAEAEKEKQRLMLESQRLRARNGAESNEDGDSVSLGGRPEEDRRLKFASLLKGVLAPMPNQEALVPMWFEDVEATLDCYDVPSEGWAGLVLPQLSERARGLLCRLTAQERKKFSKLKSSILDGLRLSAAEYKRLFSESKRREKESWDQFAVRLENYLDYYVESSKASTFKELKQLVVADRLKQCLSPEAKAHVVCNEEDAFLSPSAMAKLAERFEESERSRSAQRKASVEEGQKKPKTLADGPTDARWKKRCFECKSTDHFARDCPQKGFVAKQGNKSAARPEKRPVVARVMGPAFESTVGTTDRVGQDTQPKQHGLATVTLKSSGQPFDAVVDSGAEVSVIRKSVLPKYDSTGSQIKLTGAFGQQVIAELAYVPLTASEGSPYVGSEAGQAAVLCALTDKLLEGTYALITPNDYAQLLEERAFPNGVPDERPTAKETGAAAEEAGETCEEQPATTCVLITEGSSEAPEPVKSKREEFREAQVADPALRDAWAQAKAGTHGMLVQDELLYHQEYVAGRACKQLVLPSHRHKGVLKMAHDSPWAGHLGERKTLQRVKSSFYWPRVSQDVKEYVGRYNLRATHKQFVAGDQVLWLEKDGEGKLMAKCKGPVTVIEKLRPYSYMIELEDGSRRAVHANKLRSCHTRVTAVGVIFEGDQEFGDVPVIPSRTQKYQGGRCLRSPFNLPELIVVLLAD
ncbi:uncharacterized protein LOC144153369 [Haemaphysalis longicornis]